MGGQSGWRLLQGCCLRCSAGATGGRTTRPRSSLEVKYSPSEVNIYHIGNIEYSPSEVAPVTTSPLPGLFGDWLTWGESRLLLRLCRASTFLTFICSLWCKTSKRHPETNLVLIREAVLEKVKVCKSPLKHFKQEEH